MGAFYFRLYGTKRGWLKILSLGPRTGFTPFFISSYQDFNCVPSLEAVNMNDWDLLYYGIGEDAAYR